MLKKFLQDESGATAIEYGVIAAVLSLTIIASAKVIGASLESRFESVSSEVDGAGNEYLNP